jgi:hypothetical protein
MRRLAATLTNGLNRLLVLLVALALIVVLSLGANGLWWGVDKGPAENAGASTAASKADTAGSDAPNPILTITIDHGTPVPPDRPVQIELRR